MGLLDRLKTELVDIVEWVDDSQHTLVWRFPRFQNEIKNGAQLIVRPGQAAVFVDQGQIADVFEPGRYELKTENLPLLSTLKGWKYGFSSPFKCEVYFVSTRQLTDLKWGTPNPIMLRDADFGPIRLRAFGTYALRALNPPVLVRELVGAGHAFQAEEVGELLRALIVESFTDMLGEAKIAALDLAANYRDLSEQLRRRVCERIDDEYGLEVPALFIVNVSFPPEVEKALDTRATMGVLGDMSRFQQYQVAQAIGASGAAAGGAVSAGLGFGLGIGMAPHVLSGAALAGAGAPPPGAALSGPAVPMVPPPPPEVSFHVSQAGQVTGPHSLSELTRAIQEGRVVPATLVWSPGMSGWADAGSVGALAGLFARMVPPPPPRP